jgi:hypothetical protein
VFVLACVRAVEQGGREAGYQLIRAFFNQLHVYFREPICMCVSVHGYVCSAFGGRTGLGRGGRAARMRGRG